MEVRGRGREYGSGEDEGEYKWGKMKENTSGEDEGARIQVGKMKENTK